MSPLTQERKDAHRQRVAGLTTQAKDYSAGNGGTLEACGTALLANAPQSFRTVCGHALSPANCVFLAMQGYQSGLLGTFNQWRERGRFVRKGEKGLLVRRPVMKKTGSSTNNGGGESSATPAGSGDSGDSTARFFVWYPVFSENQLADGETQEVAAREDARDELPTVNPEAEAEQEALAHGFGTEFLVRFGGGTEKITALRVVEPFPGIKLVIHSTRAGDASGAPYTASSTVSGYAVAQGATVAEAEENAAQIIMEKGVDHTRQLIQSHALTL